MNSTLTKVRNGVWRINNPHVGAALTRSGGIASPRTISRCFAAIGCPAEESLNYGISFRRGNNTKSWYFRLTRKNRVS